VTQAPNSILLNEVVSTKLVACSSFFCTIAW